MWHPVVMALLNSETIVAWKAAALKPDTSTPVPPHTLDQILAAARDAGLSEREQGVLIMTMTLGDVERKLSVAGQASKVPLTKKLALAASMALRMLDKAP